MSMSDVNEITCGKVSLSACADLQRAWEGPQGSLTVVLCDFLGEEHLAFLVLRG